jgi:hypothetical protein
MLTVEKQETVTYNTSILLRANLMLTVQGEKQKVGNKNA